MKESILIGIALIATSTNIHAYYEITPQDPLDSNGHPRNGTYDIKCENKMMHHAHKTVTSKINGANIIYTITDPGGKIYNFINNLNAAAAASCGELH